MSSYVIDKKEYIKIAGFLAGLQSAKKYGDSALYFWNTETHSLYTASELYSLLTAVYECNALSVAIQYNISPAIDQNTYNSTFEEYKKISYNLYSMSYYTSLKKYYYSFIGFIRCFNYQTEDNFLNEKGMNILKTILFKLSCCIFEKDSSGFWGTFSDQKEG